MAVGSDVFETKTQVLVEEAEVVYHVGLGGTFLSKVIVTIGNSWRLSLLMARVPLDSFRKS